MTPEDMRRRSVLKELECGVLPAGYDNLGGTVTGDLILAADLQRKELDTALEEDHRMAVELHTMEERGALELQMRKRRAEHMLSARPTARTLEMSDSALGKELVVFKPPPPSPYQHEDPSADDVPTRRMTWRTCSSASGSMRRCLRRRRRWSQLGSNCSSPQSSRLVGTFWTAPRAHRCPTTSALRWR